MKKSAIKKKGINTTSITFKTKDGDYGTYIFAVEDILGDKKFQPNTKLAQVMEFLSNTYELAGENDINVTVMASHFSLQILDKKFKENLNNLPQPICIIHHTPREMQVMYHRLELVKTVAQTAIDLDIEEDTVSHHFGNCLEKHEIHDEYSDTQKALLLLKVWMKYFSGWVDPDEGK